MVLQTEKTVPDTLDKISRMGNGILGTLDKPNSCRASGVLGIFGALGNIFGSLDRLAG